MSARGPKTYVSGSICHSTAKSDDSSAFRNTANLVSGLSVWLKITFYNSHKVGECKLETSK